METREHVSVHWQQGNKTAIRRYLSDITDMIKNMRHHSCRDVCREHLYFRFGYSYERRLVDEEKTGWFSNGNISQYIMKACDYGSSRYSIAWL